MEDLIIGKRELSPDAASVTILPDHLLRGVSGDGSSRLFSSALWSQAEPFSPAVHHQGVNESRPSPTAHPVSLVAGCFCLVFYNKSVVY